jgi:hypothetical protein
MHASTQETPQAIIDSGVSCCVTPYLEDFLIQPTPIQNTMLKGIAGVLIAWDEEQYNSKLNEPTKNHSYS